MATRARNRMFTWVLAFLIVPILIGSLPAMELDQQELQQAAGIDIQFENYRGPEDRIDSAQAIIAIGTALGTPLNTAARADYAGRYRITRYNGSPADPGRAADVLEFLPQARVDRIENVRRILVGYLEAAWGYSRADAQLLARFITIYNAVHRGDLEFFAARYRPAVVSALAPDRVGLALRFSEWPGRTQIVIPIQPQRGAGRLDAVDPGQLFDGAVLAELRRRADLGIEDRKELIAFIERVIVERAAAIEAERVEIATQREELERMREQLAPPIQPTAPSVIDQTMVAPPAAPAAVTPAVTPAPAEASTEVPTPESPAPTAQPTTAATTEPSGEALPAASPAAPATAAAQAESPVAAAESRLAAREEALSQEEAALEELTAQVTQLYDTTAADQAAVQAGTAPVAGVRRVFMLSDASGNLELAVVDTGVGRVVGAQTIPLASREIVAVQGDYVVTHRSNGRLLRVDGATMDVVAESDRPVVTGSRVIWHENELYAVVSEAGAAYVGRFGPDLVLRARSAERVRLRTDIVIVGQSVVVQGADGDIRVLNRDSFR